MKKLRLGYWRLEEVRLVKLAFANDMVIVADSEEALQFNLNVLEEELEKFNMLINITKTKTMIIANRTKKHCIKLKEKIIEQVQAFKYLGSVIAEHGTLDLELNERLRSISRLFISV